MTWVDEGVISGGSGIFYFQEKGKFITASGNVPFAAIFQSKQKIHRKTSDYKILFLRNERNFRSFFYLCILKTA